MNDNLKRRMMNNIAVHLNLLKKRIAFQSFKISVYFQVR